MRQMSVLVAGVLLLGLVAGCAASSSTEDTPEPSQVEVDDPVVLEQTGGEPPAEAQSDYPYSRQMCFITDLSQGDDGYLATVDLVVWLTGDEAIAASGGDAPNGYHILNENTGSWVFPIADDASVVLLEGASPAAAVPVSELAAIFSDEPGEQGYKTFSPYLITIGDDVITEIQEQYRP